MRSSSGYNSEPYGKRGGVQVRELATKGSPAAETLTFSPASAFAGSTARIHLGSSSSGVSKPGPKAAPVSGTASSSGSGAHMGSTSTKCTPTWRLRGAAPAKEPAGPAGPYFPKTGSPLPLWRHPFLGGHHNRGRRLVAAGGALLTALLMCWVVRDGMQQSRRGLPGWGTAPEMGLPSSSGAAFGGQHGGPVYVEFTAPGLFVRLRDALELSLPPNPSEQRLLDLLPTPAELGATPATPARESIEHHLQEEARKQEELIKQEGEGERQRANMALARAEYWRRMANLGGGGGGTGRGREGTVARESGPQGGAMAAALAGVGPGDAWRPAGREQAGAQAGAGGQGQVGSQGAETAAGRKDRMVERAGLNQVQAQQVEQGQEVQHAQQAQQAEQAQKVEQGQQAELVQQAEPQFWVEDRLRISEKRLLEARHEEGPQVMLLVGVTSACCTEKAFRRRQAVRESWARHALHTHANIVDIKFVLAQPESQEALERWLPILEDEVRQYNDTVVLRGADTYHNLPNKSVRLLRYAATHPRRYTHVLKTDDDCYVRLPHLLKALEVPDPATLPCFDSWHRPPVYSDGLSTYSLSDLTRKLGPSKWLDDGEGNAFSLAQLLNASRTGVHPWGWRGAAGSSPSPKARAHNTAVVGSASVELVRQHAQRAAAARSVRRSGVYMGCVENKNGFWPIRDPKSKWYISPEVLPDSALPYGVKYHAGWGYLLSMDLVEHAVKKVNYWQQNPDKAPAWFKPMDWEDVLVGFLVMDVVSEPEDHPGFRAAWRACPNTTAVVHLDVDAPVLMPGLYAQDVSGLWDKKSVQCSSGSFLPGDYSGWKRWRDSLADVERL